MKNKPGQIYKKYHITKADGTPVDPSARYFVLRVDGSHYWERIALETYAQKILESEKSTTEDRIFAAELYKWLRDLDRDYYLSYEQ